MQLLNLLLTIFLFCAPLISRMPLCAASAEAATALNTTFAKGSLSLTKAEIFDEALDLLFLGFKQFFKLNAANQAVLDEYRDCCTLESYLNNYYANYAIPHPFFLLSDQRNPLVLRHTLTMRTSLTKTGHHENRFIVLQAAGNLDNPCLSEKLITAIFELSLNQRRSVTIFNRAECQYYNKILSAFNFLIGSERVPLVVYVPAASSLSPEDAATLRHCFSAPVGRMLDHFQTRQTRGGSDASYFGLPHMQAAAAVEAEMFAPRPAAAVVSSPRRGTPRPASPQRLRRPTSAAGVHTGLTPTYSESFDECCEGDDSDAERSADCGFKPIEEGKATKSGNGAWCFGSSDDGKDED